MKVNGTHEGDSRLQRTKGSRKSGAGGATCVSPGWRTSTDCTGHFLPRDPVASQPAALWTPPPPTAPASRLNVRLREGSKPRSFPADTSAARAGVEREKKVDVPGGTTLENLIMFFSDTMRETRWWSGGQRKSFYLTSLHLARCGLGEKKHK